MTSPHNQVSAPGWQQPAGAPQPPQQYAPGQYGQPPAQYPPQGQYPQPGQYQQGGPYQQPGPYQQAPAAPAQQYPQQGQFPPAQQYPQPGQLPPGQDGQQQLQADFLKHTGMLLWWQQSTNTHTGTVEDLRRAYTKAQTHNLLFGWWSISSVLVFNWWAIFRNMYEYHKVKKAAGR
ncbi:hypothetical protein [Actinocatenispora sera]|uniref:Uncharacterized protein n=1 Tax=Actinocatenispora sera TaxID=390989 RepID=A0A810LB21_9ACTN|nr:hypothetical protein [Actinocatenispora sera]BCJ31218.1 hypothetical protein Asera_53260 [Actinocatenispora sera]